MARFDVTATGELFVIEIHEKQHKMQAAVARNEQWKQMRKTFWRRDEQMAQAQCGRAEHRTQIEQLSHCRIITESNQQTDIPFGIGEALLGRQRKNGSQRNQIKCAQRKEGNDNIIDDNQWKHAERGNLQEPKAHQWIIGKLENHWNRN